MVALQPNSFIITSKRIFFVSLCSQLCRWWLLLLVRCPAHNHVNVMRYYCVNGIWIVIPFGMACLFPWLCNVIFDGGQTILWQKKSSIWCSSPWWMRRCAWIHLTVIRLETVSVVGECAIFRFRAKTQNFLYFRQRRNMKKVSGGMLREDG